jgi:non-specific serine/threonine protein kinase
VQEIKDGDPEVKLFLIEKGDYLVFQPSFSYKGYETRAKDRDEIVVPHGDKVLIVHRNRRSGKCFYFKIAKPSFKFYPQ